MRVAATTRHLLDLLDRGGHAARRGILRPRGRLVMVGVATPARFEWTPLYFKELELVGANGCGIERWEGERIHAFELYLRMLAAGRVAPGPLLTHRFPLEDYKDAFVTALDKPRHRSVKVLFDLGDP